MDEEQARAEWTSFLGRGRLRHWLWLVVDVAFLPLTLLLMPLPGPNLIGYWFLYRAVHHVLILIGLAKVRRGYVATGFTAEKGLDGRDPAERLLAVGCEPESVVGFLRRHQVRTDTPVHQP